MRRDWNLFNYNGLPLAFNYQDSTISGGHPSPDDPRFVQYSARSTRVEGYDAASGGNTWGFLYNGADDGHTHKILDGSISCALRLENTAFATNPEMTGLIMRMQTLPSDGASITNAARDFYMVGVYKDHSTSGTAETRAWRVLDGVATQLGSSWQLPIVDNSFVQFEIQLENVAGDVVLRRRHNNGGDEELQFPGETSWTSYTDIATDVGHGGVLNTSGYWGFGQYSAGIWASGASANYIYFDDIIFKREI